MTDHISCMGRWVSGAKNWIDSTENLDKTTQVVKDVAAVAGQALQNAGKTCEAVSAIGHTAGGFCAVVGGMNVVFGLAELIKNYGTMNWAEKVSISLCTLSDGIAAGLFAWNDLHVGTLVQNGGNAILKAAGSAARIGSGLSIIPFVDLAANAILIPAALFGIAGYAIKLDKSAEGLDVVQQKVDKWKNRALQNGKQFWTEHYKDKGRSYTRYLNACKDSVDRCVLHAADKQLYWAGQLSEKRDEVHRERVLSWMGIADNVMKIALGILGIVLTVVGLATGVALPAAALVLAISFLINHSFSLARKLYEWKTEKGEQEPSPKPCSMASIVNEWSKTAA